MILWTILTVLLSQCATFHGQSRVALSNATALYARAIRLSHNVDPAKDGQIVASVAAFPNGKAQVNLYTSSNGENFKMVGAITDPDFSGGLCCGTLYELPSRLGTMAPGTLLWAGSVGQSSTTAPMQVKIYQSSDQGTTWTYLSNCATALTPDNVGGGLWEPQFEFANDGALVCFYSDETQAGHSQLIHQVRSYNGVHWQDSTFTVASTLQADRPGMPVVTKLPSGIFFMTYELCGPAACTVFYRNSIDGWNWGDATNMGTKIVTATGQWFEHAPTNAWAPSQTSSNGTILLVGQMMFDSSGALSNGNGVTVFTNHTADGSGTWNTMPAPVPVPDAYSNYCPNYSSPLLPSADGKSVLEFASDYAGSICTMYYATGPVNAGTKTPTVQVTPASSNITAGHSLVVKISVSGSAGVTPTGTVILTSGSYSSGAIQLTNSTASITVPANNLAAGTDTLTVSYSGDSNYSSSSGNGPISVTAAVAAAFTVSRSSLTVTVGATSGNTSTITVTPIGSVIGSVVMTAQISSSRAREKFQPTLSFVTTSPVNIQGIAVGSATRKVSTTAATNSSLPYPSGPRRAWHALSLGSLPCALFLVFRGGGETCARCPLVWHCSRSSPLVHLAALRRLDAEEQGVAD